MPKDNTDDSTAFTLRFKHGRITILLYSQPLTSLQDTIPELLYALRLRYPSGLPTSSGKTIPIPTETSDVILGVLNDSHDPSKGWKELSLSGDEMEDSPKALAIRDQAPLAFRFGQEKDFEVQWPSYDDEEGMQVDRRLDDGEEEDVDVDVDDEDIEVPQL